MFSFKKEKKKEQKSDEKPEKQIIKRLEEEIEFLGKFHSDSEIEDEDDQVKICVAERNSKGHLQKLEPFYIPYDNIQFLQEWVKERYGQGRYCVYLQKGSYRSKGVDIWIGAGFRRESPRGRVVEGVGNASHAREQEKTPFEERLEYFNRVAEAMLKAGVKPEDFYKYQREWLDAYMKSRYGQKQEQKKESELGIRNKNTTRAPLPLPQPNSSAFRAKRTKSPASFFLAALEWRELRETKQSHYRV